MKKIRAIGIDDSPFKKGDNHCFIIGVIYRPEIVEGVLSTKIKIDGNDATDKIIEMIKRSRFSDEIKVIFLNSITFGGLNIVDINKISKSLNVPVACITRKKPTLKLKKLVEKLKKETINPPKAFEINEIYAQYVGDFKKIKEYINLFTNIGNVPEPLRLAHIIASGVFTGQSRGRIWKLEKKNGIFLH